MTANFVRGKRQPSALTKSLRNKEWYNTQVDLHNHMFHLKILCLTANSTNICRCNCFKLETDLDLFNCKNKGLKNYFIQVNYYISQTHLGEF